METKIILVIQNREITILLIGKW